MAQEYGPGGPQPWYNNSGETMKGGKPENLKPWKPGQSGNPRGRPPERPIAAELKRLGTEVVAVTVTQADGSRKTIQCSRLEALAIQAWQRAMSGDYRWGQELLNRIDGKVSEEIHLIDDSQERQDRQRTFEAIFANPELLKRAMGVAESLEAINQRLPPPPPEPEES